MIMVIYTCAAMWYFIIGDEFMKKISAIFLVVCMCLQLCSCAVNTFQYEEEATKTGKMISFTDDLGDYFEILPPGRVAVMIGSFAQVWCLAGGKDSLVATAADAWTAFDLGLDEKVINLGTVKEPNMERLLASRPDLIIASCNTQANLDMKDTLKNAGIPAAYFDVQNLDDYLNLLKICTQLTGCPENYKLYGSDVKEQVDAVKARIDGSAPTVLCMRSTGSSCKVKGSRDNLLGEMLFDMGCVNIADSDKSLLEQLSLESIIAAEPEYIFVVLQGTDPARAMETLQHTLLSNPAWNELSAVKEGRFHTLEHELFNLKPNDRWGEAYEKLADILYPEK